LGIKGEVFEQPEVEAAEAKPTAAPRRQAPSLPRRQRGCGLN